MSSSRIFIVKNKLRELFFLNQLSLVDISVFPRPLIFMELSKALLFWHYLSVYPRDKRRKAEGSPGQSKDKCFCCVQHTLTVHLWHCTTVVHISLSLRSREFLATQHNSPGLANTGKQSEWWWQCWQDGDPPLSLNTTDSTAGTWRHFRDKYLCVQEQQQWEWEQCWSRVTGVDSSDNDKQSSIYWVEVDIFLVWSVELVAVKLWIIFVKVSQTL